MKNYYYLFLTMEQHKFGMLHKAVVSLTLEIMYQGNMCILISRNFLLPIFNLKRFTTGQKIYKME